MREILQSYIVFIEAIWEDSGNTSRGTGFFINRSGLILTCQHLIYNGSGCARKITASWENNTFELELVNVSPDPENLDYVLLRAKSRHIPAEAGVARLGVWEKSQNENYQFENFETYGFRSKTMKGLHATGHIDGLIGTVNSDWHVLQLEPRANKLDAGKEGMSGAPVYHKASGCVVGMILGRLEEDDSTYPLAVPIEEICKTCAPVLELVEKGNLYNVLVDVLRPGRWYTSDGLLSLYNNLTYPGLPPYESLGENKAVEIVNFFWEQDQCEHLAHYIEGQGVLPPVNRLRIRKNINFVNRKHELEKAFLDQVVGIDPVPYIFFEAPAGYGKTELLHAIERRYFKEGWLFFYQSAWDQNAGKGLHSTDLIRMIAKAFGCDEDLSADEISQGELPLRIAFCIRNRLKSLRTHASIGVAILIDNMEYLVGRDIDLLADFLNALLKELNRCGVPLKVRFAGRKNASLWKVKFNGTPVIEVVPLSPFRLIYIRETLRRKFPSHQQLGLYAAWLMYTTGGHPDCMAEIIGLIEAKPDVDSVFLHFQEESRARVLSKIEQIDQSISDSLKPYFSNLCVFRCYSLHLLEMIMKEGIIPSTIDAPTLEEKLTENFLVERVNFFIRDNIVRRLLALRFYWQAPEKFVYTCQRALQIYQTELSDMEDDAVHMLVECLYQELQLHFFSHDQDLAARKLLWNDFFTGRPEKPAILETYLDLIFSKRRWRDIARNFIKVINDIDDESVCEFRFAVNFMMRGDDYDETPIRHLLQKVKSFFSKKNLRLSI